MDKINANTVRQYMSKLHARGEAASVIKRKLRSVEKFMEWAKGKGYLKESSGLIREIGVLEGLGDLGKDKSQDQGWTWTPQGWPNGLPWGGIIRPSEIYCPNNYSSLHLSVMGPGSIINFLSVIVLHSPTRRP